MISLRISLLLVMVSLAIPPGWSRADGVNDTLQAVRSAARKKDTGGVVARFPRLTYLYTLKAPPGSPRITPEMLRGLRAAKDRFFAFARGLLGSMDDFRAVEVIRCPIKAPGPPSGGFLEMGLVRVRHPWSRFLTAWKAMSRERDAAAMKRLEKGLTARGDLVKVGSRRYVYSLIVLIRVSPATRALFKRRFGWTNPKVKDGAWVIDRFDQRSSGQTAWQRIKTRLKCRPADQASPAKPGAGG
jgi:hypothetical protein